MHHIEPASSAADLPSRPDWQHRVVVVILALVGTVVAWLLAAAFLPRWWSHRVGAIVNDSISTGITFGLFCGVLFTLVPLLVVRLAVRRRRTWRQRVLLLAVAIVLAVPNLLTLWIVLGSSKAAHAGERTLDVEGTGFRGASASGAIIGAALFAAFAWLLASRNRRGRQVGRLRDELDRERRRDTENSGPSTPAS